MGEKGPVKITGRAAQAVIDFTRDDIAELGEGHVPAIAWINWDSDPRARVPRLAMGKAEKHQVEERYLPCDELTARSVGCFQTIFC